MPKRLMSSYAAFVFTLLLAVVNSSVFAQLQGRPRIDSLLSVLNAPPADDTSLINIYNALGYAYTNINPDSGLWYSAKALELAQKVQYLKGQGDAYSDIGLNLLSKSDYAGSLESQLKALSVFEELESEEDIAVILGNIGVVYDVQRHYDKALQYYQRAMSGFRRTRNTRSAASTLGNMGLIFKARGNYEEALRCFDESLNYATEVRDTSAMAICLLNIGTTRLLLKDYSGTLQNYSLSIDLARKSEDLFTEGIVLCNLGELYFLIATGHDEHLADSLFGGSRQKGLDRAESELLESVRIFEGMGFMNGLQESHQYLANVYEAQGAYNKALQSLKIHLSVRDSVFSEENEIRFRQLEAQRIADIKQKEIEIQKLKVQKAERDRWLLLAAVISLAIIIFILYGRFHAKKISNQQLTQTLEDLKNTQKQLVQQEKMASLGTLAAGVAHEIQNPLNFVNNFSELSHELITELETEKDDSVRKLIMEDVRENLTKIRTHGKRADAIVKNMLLLSRAENGIRETTDINKLCDEAINFCFHAMPSNTPGFNCRIIKDYADALPGVQMVRTEVSRVILNLLNNAVYALKQKKQEGSDPDFDPQITVSTEQAGNQVIIQVRDNGNGIPDHVMKKIFVPFFTTKPPNEGTGLGLSMSFDIIKAHGGMLTAFNDHGAVFQLELPIDRS